MLHLVQIVDVFYCQRKRKIKDLTTIGCFVVFYYNYEYYQCTHKELAFLSICIRYHDVNKYSILSTSSKFDFELKPSIFMSRHIIRHGRERYQHTP